MASTVEPTKTIEIFISYSHKDQRLRDELETQPSLLIRTIVEGGRWIYYGFDGFI